MRGADRGDRISRIACLRRTKVPKTRGRGSPAPNATSRRRLRAVTGGDLDGSKSTRVPEQQEELRQFLANMSHELRTPLHSILVLAKMLADNEHATLSQEEVEYAKTILESGTALLAIVDQILDFSKMEAGKMEIHAGEVPLASICDHVDRTFRPIAAQRNLELTIVLEPDAPASIVTDEQRLRQILHNLLGNALKFTERGGVVVRIGVATKNVTFSVEDTGIGIPTEKQRMIFEAFRQADGTTTRKYGGTGLGLSISRSLAELLGGEIQVASAPGEGSTFTLCLPPGVPVARARWGSHPRGETVLVVDDDVRDVFALTQLLERSGMSAVCAESGRDAIEILRSVPDVRLVLMDVTMPGMDGDETTRAIRADPSHASLPIIALSKPVDCDQLLSQMRAGLYGRDTAPAMAESR
jgi:signal transduction histidine kinase/CheY-like chemotaxis protein